MPLMLREAQLHGPQYVELQAYGVARRGLVWRGDDPRDDAVARPELLARGGQPPGDGLDHRLEPLAGLVGRHRVLLLAVHEDARGTGVQGLDAGSEGDGTVEDVARQDLLHGQVEVRRVGDLEGGEESGDRAAVRADLERDFALHYHGVFVPIPLDEAVGRQEPGERRVDPEPLLRRAHVEPDLPPDRVGALREDLAAAGEEGRSAAVDVRLALPAHGFITILSASRLSYTAYASAASSSFMWWVTSGPGSSTPASSIARTRSTWPITLACPVFSVSALIQTIPMWTSTRSAYTPIAETMPALRATRQASSSASGWPTASIAASTPRPSVAVFTAARGSSSVRWTGWAPNVAARSSRSATVSIAITLAAPEALAAWTAHRPTGPRPSTATESPGRTPAWSTACQPVPITSPANRAASSDMPSGTRRSVRLACGTSTCSAWAPWSEPSARPWPKTRPSSHLWKSPRRQKKQVPQAEQKQPSTRSPSDASVTASPAATTVPTNSWPSVKPGSISTRPW